MTAIQTHLLSAIQLDAEYLAYYWRGRCLDHFSHMEAAISDCIEAIRKLGGSLDSDSKHPGAAARSRSLATALKTQQFGGHQRVAIKRLEEWADLAAHRPGLAHGRFEITADGVTVRLSEYQGGERLDHPARSYTTEEMRLLLARLENHVQKLVVQLGQVQAYCRKATN